MERKLKKQAIALAIRVGAVLAFTDASAAPGANLNQARNGTDSLPVNPMQWVNGNLGAGNAHFIEGMSAPYQCVMTGLSAGVQVTITFGYDITNSGKHAIDYLTHYSRITPHGFGYHSTPEVINPLAGSGLAAATPFTIYPIPAPSSAGSPVSGQPTASFNSLTSNERQMTLYNGTIDTIYYGVQGNPNAASSETQIVIKFTPAATTAVLVWGGHIGSRLDWGYTGGSPNSAGGISGSPFHMRLVSWSLNNLGNQDRSQSGSSVSGPPMPLPVELLSFAAHPDGAAILIEWSTATEINNDHFSIERSSGINNFEALATVIGAGNSSTTQDYSWTDNLPLSGISYYRLVQSDYDGTRTVYGPIGVQSKVKKQTLSELKVIANTSTDEFYVTFFAPTNGSVLLEFLTTDGKLIQSEVLNAAEGVNFKEVGYLQRREKGIYIVRLSNGDTPALTQKILLN